MSTGSPLFDLLDRARDVYRAETYEKAAALIEEVGLWQGFYWGGSHASYTPGQPVCALGALAVAAHGPEAAVCHVGDVDQLAAHAVEVLVERDPALPSYIGTLQNFSDEFVLISDIGGECLGSPEHAAEVAQLFRDTAARLRGNGV